MTVPPEELLARAGWVRRLARRMAVDATRADDLAQDTLVAALEGGPRDGVPLSRWLASVMRNLAAGQRRSRARREDREVRAARRESEPEGAPDDALARLEVHAALVDAVRSLPAGQRDAILARYFDGLTPREIAKRTNTPVRTVHTRLARGLAELRRRMDSSGERPLSGWLPLLLPFPPKSGGVLGAALGGLLVDTKLKLAAATLATAGLVVATKPVWQPSAPLAPADVVVEDAHRSQLASSGEEAQRAVSTERSVTRAAVTETADGPTAPSEPVVVDPVSTLIEGRVFDLEGHPVPGVAVRYVPEGGEPQESVGSDASGAFALDIEQQSGRVECADDAWTSVFEPVLPGFHRTFGDSGSEHVLVVAPAVRIEGRVTDTGGMPLEGARVSVWLPVNLRARFPEAIGGSRQAVWSAESDGLGRFELVAGAIGNATLITSRPGLESDHRALPTLSVLDMEIVLGRPTAESEHLAGTVVDPDGRPVEGAYVALGLSHARSGPDGTFVLRLQPGGPTQRLSALKQGYQPAFLDAPDGSLVRTLELPDDEHHRAYQGREVHAAPSKDGWPDPLVLQLGEPPLSLAGSVVDEDGAPLAGLGVELVDRTHFGSVEAPDRPDVSYAGWVEDLLGEGGKGASQPRGQLLTDERGAFRVEGLLPRAYTLRVTDTERLVSADFGPFEAGQRLLELVLAAEELDALVAGRVLSLAGEPLEGLAVTPLRPIPDGQREHDLPGWFDDFVQGTMAFTDADGAFRFEPLAAAVTSLSISGPAVGFGTRVELAAGADRTQLELRLPVICRLQLLLEGSGLSASSFRLEDDRGETVQVQQYEGDFAYSTDTVWIGGGRSGVVSAPESATTLVLLLGSSVVREVPLALAPGVLNEIRP